MKGIPLFMPYSLRSKAIVPVISPFARTSQIQCFVLRDSTNCEFARNVEGVRTGLYHLPGVKRNVRVLIDVEKIFAFQLSRIHAGCLNLDIQGATLCGCRRDGKSGIPLLKSTFDRYRSLRGKLNRALD